MYAAIIPPGTIPVLENSSTAALKARFISDRNARDTKTSEKRMASLRLGGGASLPDVTSLNAGDP
jgi:hypothetical protein